jgi:hypothetical protein
MTKPVAAPADQIVTQTTVVAAAYLAWTEALKLLADERAKLSGYQDASYAKEAAYRSEQDKLNQMVGVV